MAYYANAHMPQSRSTGIRGIPFTSYQLHLVIVSAFGDRGANELREACQDTFKCFQYLKFEKLNLNTKNINY